MYVVAIVMYLSLSLAVHTRMFCMWLGSNELCILIAISMEPMDDV